MRISGIKATHSCLRDEIGERNEPTSMRVYICFVPGIDLLILDLDDVNERHYSVVAGEVLNSCRVPVVFTIKSLFDFRNDGFNSDAWR